MYGIQQDENSINMSVSMNANVKRVAPIETVLVEPTLPLPIRDSFIRNSEMEPSSSSSASDKGKDKHVEEESFVGCLASAQEPKTKTIGVTAATVAAANEIMKEKTLSASHTDGDSRQQEQQVVTHLNPATNIVLVPFTQGNNNNAAKRKQQGDKYEFSPTGRAKCTKCRKVINKGEKRVGKEVYEERYSDYTHRYYHDQCYPKALKEQLMLKAATPEDELVRAVKEQRKESSVVHGERLELYEALRTLRYGFGQKLDCEDQLARIFSNKTLEQMTLKMPTNQQDMIANVFGMGPKKYESFGEAFLQVIQHYARKYGRAQTTESPAGASTGTGPTKSSTVTSRTAVVVSTAAAAGGTDTTQIAKIDSDDDDIEALESLSCTEIIQRKFEHAATNGYVISLE
jgi:hypothetical protein